MSRLLTYQFFIPKPNKYWFAIQHALKYSFVKLFYLDSVNKDNKDEDKADQT